MRTLLSFAVALAISLSPLIALEWNARKALPDGVVTISEIVEPGDLARLARADGRVEPAARSL